MEEFLKLVFISLISACLAIWGFAKFALEKYTEGYLKEKGKNLASKQDISELTRIVETIKHENNLILEKIRGRYQLRMAALDKRLEVHQQAYVLWHNLLSTVHHKEKIGDMVYECQEWWFKNCLYLDQTARETFYEAYQAAAIHSDLMAQRKRQRL